MTDVTFQRLLQSVLYDNMYDRYVSNRRSGKLDGKKLRKISYSDKFFKKKEERKNKDYSIALVVDCSGSMNGEKAQFAFESAKKLSKHLSSAKINHAVYAFHAVTDQVKAWNKAYDPDTDKKLVLMLGEQYGYWKDVYKEGENPDEDYPESTEYMGKRIQFLPKVKKTGISGYDHAEGAGDNNDAHALRFVAKELMHQKGTKLMIVLSDGQPVYSSDDWQVPDFPKEKFGDKRDLKHEVKDIIHAGIELHSIGIMTDSVNNYYPPTRTCAIYDLGSLYDHIIKIIKLNMKRT